MNYFRKFFAVLTSALMTLATPGFAQGNFKTISLPSGAPLAVQGTAAAGANGFSSPKLAVDAAAIEVLATAKTAPVLPGLSVQA